MSKKRYTEEQIIKVVKEVEAGIGRKSLALIRGGVVGEDDDFLSLHPREQEHGVGRDAVAIIQPRPRDAHVGRRCSRIGPATRETRFAARFVVEGSSAASPDQCRGRIRDCRTGPLPARQQCGYCSAGSDTLQHRCATDCGDAGVLSPDDWRAEADSN